MTYRRSNTCMRILQPQNGRLLLQVPAHQVLYGNMDALAGHYRRYSREYLKTILEQAGFQIERLFFFNSFGALPWLINARIVKPKTLELPMLNTQLVIYDRYFIPVLRRVEAGIQLPFWAVAHGSGTGEKEINRG